jgi:hypothetical protein
LDLLVHAASASDVTASPTKTLLTRPTFRMDTLLSP